MPKNARIFIADDQEIRRETLRAFLSNGGHTVIAEAGDLVNAKKIIADFEVLGIQVAFLDANLTEGDTKGVNGVEMAELIRNNHPDVKIVGCSNRKFPVPVDFDLHNQAEPGSLAEISERVDEL